MAHRPIVRRTAAQVVELWVKALRSGEYRQAKEVLVDRREGSFCCLGVLQDLAKKDGGCLREYDGILNDAQWNKLDLGIDQRTLARMNDKGMSFKAIAEYIETNATPTA